MNNEILENKIINKDFIRESYKENSGKFIYSIDEYHIYLEEKIIKLTKLIEKYYETII